MNSKQSISNRAQPGKKSRKDTHNEKEITSRRAGGASTQSPPSRRGLQRGRPQFSGTALEEPQGPAPASTPLSSQPLLPPRRDSQLSSFLVVSTGCDSVHKEITTNTGSTISKPSYPSCVVFLLAVPINGISVKIMIHLLLAILQVQSGAT